MKPVAEMFWAVEYKDGSVVSQIDPHRMTENPYSIVNHKRAARYWWIPVPPQLSMSGFRCNPKLSKHCVETKGSQGFVSRRTRADMEIGKRNESQIEKTKRLINRPPVRVVCYVLGIEGGPRIEIYPDGTVLKLSQPRSDRETQSVLYE